LIKRRKRLGTRNYPTQAITGLEWATGRSTTGVHYETSRTSIVCDHARTLDAGILVPSKVEAAGPPQSAALEEEAEQIDCAAMSLTD
jgi:hypothetical protein